MGGSERTGGKRNNGRSVNNRKRNPQRGGPGVLITCERGREFKATREGTEILRHYFYKNDDCDPTASTDDADNGKVTDSDKTNDSQLNNDGVDEVKESKKIKMTLEEEIAMLKSGANTDQVLLDGKRKSSKKETEKGNATTAPFTIYDTGCSGIVFVMCTAPHSSLLPIDIHKGRNDDSGIIASERIEDKDEGSKVAESLSICPPITMQDDKKRKIDEVSTSTFISKETITPSKPATAKAVSNASFSSWKPIETVQQIIQGAKLSSTGKSSTCNAPSSRFVTRMIPIQATCFADITEITNTAKVLVESIMNCDKNEDKCSGVSNDRTTVTSTSLKPKLFSVVIRRRNCSNVTRDQIISKVAALVDNTKFKVDLKTPEYTILIEICRTLCGMSIIRNIHEYENFNLFEIRQKATMAKYGDVDK